MQRAVPHKYWDPAEDEVDEDEEVPAEEEDEEVVLPPEVWCLIAAYLGPGWRHLARLSLVSRYLHGVVWGQATAIDLSALSSSIASWWRSYLAQRRHRLPPDHAQPREEQEAESRDPLEHILRFVRHHSPELRWLSLPGSFALHHAPLLVADLRHLALHAVTDAESTVAATVARLPYLTSLRLSGMGVTDALLNELPGSLTSLWVESPCPDPTAFRGTFQRLPPSLTTLRLHLCHTLVIPRFDLLSPNLRTLDLTGSRRITGRMLDKLPRKLLVLKLRDCRSIMQAELAPALTRLNLLQELDLRGCEVDGSAMAFLPASLRVLRLSGPLTDGIMPLLPRQLEALTLFNMPLISDDALSCFLAEVAARLTSLTLAFCPKLTDAGLKPLPHNLVALKIKGGGRKCRITEAAFQCLPATLRRLHVASAPFVHVPSLSLPPSLYFVHRP